MEKITNRQRVMVGFRCPVELDVLLRHRAAGYRVNKTELLLHLITVGLQHIGQEETNAQNTVPQNRS